MPASHRCRAYTGAFQYNLYIENARLNGGEYDAGYNQVSVDGFGNLAEAALKHAHWFSTTTATSTCRSSLNFATSSKIAAAWFILAAMPQFFSIWRDPT
jgi:hypothetical protein